MHISSQFIQNGVLKILITNSSFTNLAYIFEQKTIPNRTEIDVFMIENVYFPPVSYTFLTNFTK